MSDWTIVLCIVLMGCAAVALPMLLDPEEADA